MFRRFAALVVAGVLAVTGLATGTAYAAPDSRPHVPAPGACDPLSLVNPTRWAAEFGYRVGRHGSVAPVAVPARSTVQRALRPRYGSGELTVQWWARGHDARAKAVAVRAAEKTRDDARDALAARKGAAEAAEQALLDFEKTNPRPVEFKDNTWQQEKDRLQGRDDAPAQEKVALIDVFLGKADAVPTAEGVLQEAQAKLDAAESASYWTRWRRGVVRVAECVTPSPSPSPTATSEPTVTPSPTVSPEPSESPVATPVPTVTHTERTVVIDREYLPVRVDTGLGGTAK